MMTATSTARRREPYAPPPPPMTEVGVSQLNRCMAGCCGAQRLLNGSQGTTIDDIDIEHDCASKCGKAVAQRLCREKSGCTPYSMQYVLDLMEQKRHGGEKKAVAFAVESKERLWLNSLIVLAAASALALFLSRKFLRGNETPKS
ncbi:MAG: hypothetical protein PHT12_03950 [Patescibacteria group bacterium]|nr:hypothetical protein [Patescibacteria group bacterium]